jgi:hypothetical protein
VIQRKRKFSARTLAQTFVLGFLRRPNASDEDLAQMAGLCGVSLTPQAVEQRFTSRLVVFLEALFRRALECAVSSSQSVAPLLERFTDVLVVDSSTISLPAEMAERFPGCGGSYGSGKAALKCQVQWSLKSGSLDTIAIEAGRDCDYKSSLQQAHLSAGTLRIADLGYFDTKVFERFSQDGVFWLSRLQFNTNVYSPDGEVLALLNWLAARKGSVDQPVLLGSKRKISCRLLAWRVPEEVANRRRQKLIAATKRKSGRVPSATRLAWCDWMILVTNVPTEKLSPAEAAVLYRARWQIELLFKRWKSSGLVAELTGATLERRMAKLWARLLAVLLQHWLLLTSTWGDPRCSLTKACEAIRSVATLLAVSLQTKPRLVETLKALLRITASTARQNKRKRPSTFELLNDPSQLEYSLT